VLEEIEPDESRKHACDQPRSEGVGQSGDVVQLGEAIGAGQGPCGAATSHSTNATESLGHDPAVMPTLAQECNWSLVAGEWMLFFTRRSKARRP
jgi:hypothetical protein